MKATQQSQTYDLAAIVVANIGVTIMLFVFIFYDSCCFISFPGNANDIAVSAYRTATEVSRRRIVADTAREKRVLSKCR